MIPLLLTALFATSASASSRTLAHDDCPRILTELVRDAEDPRAVWAPLPRVTQEELGILRSVGDRARWIEDFMVASFPGVPRQAPDRWPLYFRYLWQRIPEVTYLPPLFSSPPTVAEIETEWARFRAAFEAAPRTKARDGTVCGAPPASVRIKFNPRFRARIASLGFELRHQIESTPFEGRPILKLLGQFVDGPYRWRPGDSGPTAFRNLWQRAFGISQPEDFKLVRSGDALPVYQRRMVPEASARIVEEFRLFKMVYNRNRPPTPLPERGKK